MKTNFTIEGNIVDVVGKRIFQGKIEIKNAKVFSITEQETNISDYILPGLVDAHIHIESSMLIPSEFAKLASVHGTVATVSDPHEIANVLGIAGIKYMIENSEAVPFKIFFGAPSCVPATSFESSGASLGVKEIEELLQNDKIKYLSEMMNYPGVLFEDQEVVGKLNVAKSLNKPIDGHAPGLTGKDVKKYIESGITTDHECFTIEEALEKIKYGMKVQIREGSAAKNFEALVELINDYPDDIMFCSDDKHPDDLLLGHMNEIVKRAIKLGYDPVEVIRICTYNPINHYNLDVGLLQQNDPADFIIVDDLKNFNVKGTYVDGELIAKDGKSLIQTVAGDTPNRFIANNLNSEDIVVPYEGSKIKVIEAMDGQLVTKNKLSSPKVENENIVSDVENDILKLVVLNRYSHSKPTMGFINGFGFKSGAIASTVAHDSHNLIAVGTNDQEILNAINQLIQSKGGIALSDKNKKMHLPLPVAGIMSNKDGIKVAKQYDSINKASHELGSKLNAPFMTLSFMSLLVIPELKLSDKGLFDGNKFGFTSLSEAV